MPERSTGREASGGTLAAGAGGAAGTVAEAGVEQVAGRVAEHGLYVPMLITPLQLMGE